MHNQFGRPVQSQAVSRFKALKTLIASNELSFLVEAHNALSAQIVSEAKFDGIWASGLAISSSLGLRDANEACWSQVLDVLEYMADAASIPILADGDTGHGDFNTVRRFVRKLGERGVAGVCIEDKIFPKQNSFVGECQPLADVEEFCGRIKAAKDHQVHEDFTVVARLESFISSRGLADALMRGEAYVRAGADAILVHSKRRDASEILSFTAEWANRAPLLVVPTTYYETPVSAFEAAKISTVIWANHLIRASVLAMREAAELLSQDKTPVQLEKRIATLDDLFDLARNAELQEAELKYGFSKPRL